MIKRTIAIGATLLVFLVPAAASSQPAVSESLRGVILEYGGQKILMAHSSQGSDHVILEIPDDFAGVARFYRRHFVERGWEVKMEMAMEDTNMLSLVKDGRTLGIITARIDENIASVSFNLERE